MIQITTVDVGIEERIKKSTLKCYREMRKRQGYAVSGIYRWGGKYYFDYYKIEVQRYTRAGKSFVHNLKLDGHKVIVK